MQVSFPSTNVGEHKVKLEKRGTRYPQRHMALSGYSAGRREEGAQPQGHRHRGTQRDRTPECCGVSGENRIGEFLTIKKHGSCKQDGDSKMDSHNSNEELRNNCSGKCFL